MNILEKYITSVYESALKYEFKSKYFFDFEDVKRSACFTAGMHIAVMFFLLTWLIYITYVEFGENTANPLWTVLLPAGFFMCRVFAERYFQVRFAPRYTAKCIDRIPYRSSFILRITFLPFVVVVVITYFKIAA